MKGLGVVFVLGGAACFLLPMFDINPSWLYQLGGAQPIVAAVLVLIGMGLFFFSSYD